MVITSVNTVSNKNKVIQETKEISIQLDLYNKFELFSRFANVSISTVINKALEEYLETVDNGTLECILEDLFGTTKLSEIFEIIASKVK